MFWGFFCTTKPWRYLYISSLHIVFFLNLNLWNLIRTNKAHISFCPLNYIHYYFSSVRLSLAYSVSLPLTFTTGFLSLSFIIPFSLPYFIFLSSLFFLLSVFWIYCLVTLISVLLHPLSHSLDFNFIFLVVIFEWHTQTLTKPGSKYTHTNIQTQKLKETKTKPKNFTLHSSQK